MNPDPAAKAAIEYAVERLVRAGMVIRHRSSNSVYLGMPGHQGVLRVSDHAKKADKNENEPILARLTLPPWQLPQGDNLSVAIAIALGRYMLKATDIGNPTALSWQDGVVVGVTEALAALKRNDFMAVQVWLGNAMAAAHMEEIRNAQR